MAIEIDFETVYQLQEFRSIEKEYFNEKGELYRNIKVTPRIMEMMLKLINQLEKEIQ
jgi:hypothetical protein